MSTDRWEDSRRLEAWAGELRVNFIRTLALVVFYAYHLLNLAFFTPELRSDKTFNLSVNIVVVGWTVAIVTLHLCLSRGFMPPALKYLATLWDLWLVTALLIVSPAGPHSSLILLYFVIVAASPLRLSLPLVLTTTLGVLAAALLVLGHYVFLRIGSSVYYDPEAGKAFRVDRGSEVLFFLALGTAGLLAGQYVRQARRLVAGYAVTVIEPGEPTRKETV